MTFLPNIDIIEAPREGWGNAAHTAGGPVTFFCMKGGDIMTLLSILIHIRGFALNITFRKLKDRHSGK